MKSRDRGVVKGPSFVGLFLKYPQKSGLGQPKLASRNSFPSRAWVAGTQGLEPYMLLAMVHIRRKLKLEAEEPRLELM